ncbi:MAG: PKD domain-containing protein [Saprospiraceae bacterium]
MNILAVLLLFSYSSIAQTATFKTAITSAAFEATISDEISKVETYQLEGEGLSELVQSADFDNNLKLDFGDAHQWEFEVYSNDMFAEDASINLLTENGVESYPVPRNISFKGYVKGHPEQPVSLLIHDDYLYAHITKGDQQIYITSANRYDKNASEDLYLIFDAEDQVAPPTGGCGLDAHPEFDISGDIENEDADARLRTGLCYDVDLGIVSDFSLYTDKGSSVQSVIDHVVGVMMDVETDYETVDFDDALNFEIVEQVISTCSFCDEWTASTDPSDLLSEFTSWAGAGGFNNTIDMGQLWTDRDFDGSTVGLAYRASGLLCNSAFHVLQDYTSNANNLRVMTSHEIGHNLNASHDASSGDIMAPSVSTSTTWSALSVATIDPQIDAAATSTCITSCTATPCDPVTDVSITSINSSGFTISWTATTEGDYRLRVRDEDDFSIIYTASLSSSSSMVVNPVGWEICHRYLVMVENDCGSSVYSAPVSSIVADTDQGCADFSADNIVDWGTSNVSFSDESINASSWSWNFGDGNTSTSQNPSNNYTSPGAYEVSLSVNSNAHTKTKSSFIYVLPTGEAVPYTSASGGNMDNDDFGTSSGTEGRSSFFEKGVPSNYFNNSTNCWVTNLDGDISEEDNETHLYSPEYDFSTVSTATVLFNLGMEVQFCNAPFAVQLQYSTDGGSSWTRLGADTDASWYNRGPSQSCDISASVFSDLMGWTFNSSGGAAFSYNVDALAGNSSVIFRFAFNVASGFSSSGYTRAGAMVDNFQITATLLPVELSAFDGRLNEDEVLLNWETLSEVNNDYFLIERSTDGRTFEELGTVKGNGDQLGPINYSLVDPSPLPGVNYYRLTQFDYDGQYEVFNKLVAVEYSEDNKMEIFPNPVANDVVRFYYSSKNHHSLDVEIFNTAGQLIYATTVNAELENNVFDFPLNNVPNGVYYLNIRNEHKVNSLRFVKTR